MKLTTQNHAALELWREAGCILLVNHDFSSVGIQAGFLITKGYCHEQCIPLGYSIIYVRFYKYKVTKSPVVILLKGNTQSENDKKTCGKFCTEEFVKYSMPLSKVIPFSDYVYSTPSTIFSCCIGVYCIFILYDVFYSMYLVLQLVGSTFFSVESLRLYCVYNNFAINISSKLSV